MDRQFSSSSCSIDVVFSSVSSVRDLSSGGGGGGGGRVEIDRQKKYTDK